MYLKNKVTFHVRFAVEKTGFIGRAMFRVLAIVGGAESGGMGFS